VNCRGPIRIDTCSMCPPVVTGPFYALATPIPQEFQNQFQFPVRDLPHLMTLCPLPNLLCSQCLPFHCHFQLFYCSVQWMSKYILLLCRKDCPNMLFHLVCGAFIVPLGAKPFPTLSVYTTICFSILNLVVCGPVVEASILFFCSLWLD
jgi:hypothetical protein